MIDCTATVSIENDGTIFDEFGVETSVDTALDSVVITVGLNLGILGQSITVDIPAAALREVLAS